VEANNLRNFNLQVHEKERHCNVEVFYTLKRFTGREEEM